MCISVFHFKPFLVLGAFFLLFWVIFLVIFLAQCNFTFIRAMSTWFNPPAIQFMLTIVGNSDTFYLFNVSRGQVSL